MAAGALSFLLVYTLTQVRSVGLTLLIVATILLSFPLALAVYAVVLGFRWIGVLHFLGLFIVLGIGADDIFVRRLPALQPPQPPPQLPPAAAPCPHRAHSVLGAACCAQQPALPAFARVHICA